MNYCRNVLLVCLSIICFIPSSRAQNPCVSIVLYPTVVPYNGTFTVTLTSNVTEVGGIYSYVCAGDGWSIGPGEFIILSESFSGPINNIMSTTVGSLDGEYGQVTVCGYGGSKEGQDVTCIQGTILPPIPAPQITTTSLPLATSGVAYPPVVLSASGGNPPLVWSVSGLPSGFSLVGNTIVGVATPRVAPGTYPLTLKVQDNIGLNATPVNVALVVNGTPVGIDVSTPANMCLTPYTFVPGVGIIDEDGNDLGPPAFLISRAWGGGNQDCGAQQTLSSATGSGLPAGMAIPVAAYAFLNFNPDMPAGKANETPGNGSYQVYQALGAVGNQVNSLGFMAIDVECDYNNDNALNDCDSWSGELPHDPEIIVNNQFIYQAIQAVESAGIKPLIYTNKRSWSVLTTGTDTTINTNVSIRGTFGCIPLWDAKVGKSSLIASDDADLPFAGWQSIVGRQYDVGPTSQGVPQEGGNSVDLDTFDLSVFSPSNINGPHSCANAPSECMALDFTANATFSGLVWNPFTNIWEATVTITAPPNQPIPAPISLGLDGGLNPTIATPYAGAIAGIAGQTSCTYPAGSPYITLSNEPLEKGQSISFRLNFNSDRPKFLGPINPRPFLGPINFRYVGRVLAGPATR